MSAGSASAGSILIPRSSPLPLSVAVTSPPPATPEAPPRLANELGERLTNWTGARWVAVVSSDDGAPTLGEQAADARAEAIAEAEQHPLVKAVLDTFPDAKVTDVRPRATPPGGSDQE